MKEVAILDRGKDAAYEEDDRVSIRLSVSSRDKQTLLELVHSLGFFDGDWR